ncbi:DUF2937 family protein [Colwelliaceae bacterium 6441]
MFTLINTIIDRCLFTLTFIVGVQLPEFMNQYIQRVSGHLNEAKQQLSQFQSLADLHYQGDITLLVKQYRLNNDPVIVDTATIIEQLMNRVDHLDNHLFHLLTNDYLSNLQQFLFHMDLSMVKATAQHFTLAIPLTINALSTGFVFALLTLIVKLGLTYCVKQCSQKLWPAS